MEIVAVFAFFALLGLLNWGAGRYADNRVWRKANEFRPENKLGGARFARLEDLKALLSGIGIRIGLTPDGKKPMFYRGPGHIALIAGARAGKLVTILAAMIFSLPRGYSLYLRDPKLEITPIVARWRKQYGRVCVWNPYGMWPKHLAGVEQVQINPLADIDPSSSECSSDCEALCGTYWEDHSKAREPHWLTKSRDLTTGCIYWQVTYGEPEQKNLPYTNMILTGATGESIFAFAKRMVALGDDFLSQVFAQYADIRAPRNGELASVISTAQAQMSWLKDKTVAASLMRGDVSFREFKHTPGMTISIGLPLTRMNEKVESMISGWARHCMLDESTKGGDLPTVAIIDEMSQIGYSKAWANAFAMGAGAAKNADCCSLAGSFAS